MINIVQLSDLHFGSNDAGITKTLHKTVMNLNPDLVVVSGDLTTRARELEFVAAKEFLEPWVGKRIIVPGNHDISLYNIFRRFFKPLDRFTKIIDKEVDPHFIHNEAVVVGLNSSRSFTIKSGNISSSQIDKVKSIFQNVPGNIMRVVITHHPMKEMDKSITERLYKLGVRVFISGHLHKSDSLLKSFEVDGKTVQAVFVKAGTATSVRYRQEANSFNFLTIDNSNLKVRTYTWDLATRNFALVNEKEYKGIV